mmetsp:Transcript_21587/g.51545  ORF Transcript_21587/g.51545 Transcript_21587/m.51545 type:complete len:203 (+) Transcript_21587:575-1183(+)
MPARARASCGSQGRPRARARPGSGRPRPGRRRPRCPWWSRRTPARRPTERRSTRHSPSGSGAPRSQDGHRSGGDLPGACRCPERPATQCRQPRSPRGRPCVESARPTRRPRRARSPRRGRRPRLLRRVPERLMSQTETRADTSGEGMAGGWCPRGRHRGRRTGKAMAPPLCRGLSARGRGSGRCRGRRTGSAASPWPSVRPL